MYTNEKNIPLAVAVFLATDNYEHSTDTAEISVTTLIKSVRQILLAPTDTSEESAIDISTLIASRLGTAMHEGIEKAWLNPKKALLALGSPESISNNIAVNPTEIDDTKINIFLEGRTKKEILGRTISGCYDVIINGELGDYKNTGTYTYTKQTNDSKYILQGSIYRWLNPTIITSDVLHIYMIFKDWSANKAISSDKYPQSPVIDYKLKLLNLAETEKYVVNKLTELEKYKAMPIDSLPFCTKEDLWMDDPTFAYYANPEGKRATKIFDDIQEAHNYLHLKGKGIVKERMAEPRACRYCSAVNCNQKQNFIDKGILK